jgi:hypothetical protein
MHIDVSNRHRRGDDGISLVLFALTVTVLLVFVAFAVDLGAAFGEKRKSQNTADAGALAGGRFLLVAKTPPGSAPNDAAIASEVMLITHRNLQNDSVFSDANSLTLNQWQARFASCTDPERDAAAFPLVSGSSACISYNTAMTRVRVRLPSLRVPTMFAGVIGINALTVNAAAEAEIIPDGSGGLLPFGLPGGTANNTEVCLKSGSQPNLPPCNGPVTGNFGSLDIAFYGNPVLGTPTVCTGETNLRLEVNIAMGVDHPMDEYREAGESSEAIRNDRTLCPELEARPNQMLGQPGIGSNIDQGLLAGATLEGRPIAGRLTRGPWATRHVRSDTPDVDNRPLWEFIDPSLADPTIPSSCVRGSIDNKAEMVACLDAYKIGGFTTPLFTADDDVNGAPDILQSPRLAFVPEFHELAWSTGSKPYPIKAFRAVFLQTLYFKCSSGQGGSCDGVFDPGEPGSGMPAVKNDNIEALTALLLNDKMVPPVVLQRGPAGTREYTLILRR